MSKTEFPLMVRDFVEANLNKAADEKVNSFKKVVYPLLFKFGLMDDSHIEKYLSSETTEDIYKDALRENPKAVFAMEQEAIFNEEADVWEKLRNPNSPVKTPKEEGFIFREIPYAKSAVSKAISVKNGELVINRKLFYEASIVRPTDEQKEEFEILSDFCEIINKKKLYKKYLPQTMFLFDEQGMKPNIYTILGTTWISKGKTS